MLQYLLQLQKFIPNEFEHSVFQIDFKKLYANGFRTIITDLDNTLISYQDTEPTDEIIHLFEELQTLGFAIVLLSNNVPKRIEDFTKNMDIKGFANARKPLLIGLKKAFKSVPNATKQTTIVIGDQLVTDIWGANRFKVYSILVNPIKKKTEKWYTKMNRKLELKMIERIKKERFETYTFLGLEKRQ
jgi:HAD superfamily phosphatase (TIGR01668 family)